MDSTSGLMPNVTANSKASDIISELSSYNISVTITNANGDTLDTADLIGTGCKVLASDGTEYTVIVCGDVDGTGNVKSTDYLLAEKALKEHNCTVALTDVLTIRIDDAKNIDVREGASE